MKNDTNENIKTLLNIMKQEKITQEKMGNILGTSRVFVSKIISGDKPFPSSRINILKSSFPKYFNEEITYSNTDSSDLVPVTFRPDVYLSAGYGCNPCSEASEVALIDSKLLVTRKGISINPKFCEIVTVSGDSMSPEYQDGDRVIIDKSVTSFIDGHIFAFGYNGQCYIKIINLLPDKIKCIPLNPQYDAFYLSKEDTISIYGLIIPRVRF